MLELIIYLLDLESIEALLTQYVFMCFYQLVLVSGI